ncbi:hypothetical protein D3C80_1419950 [compost metagenome]
MQDRLLLKIALGTSRVHIFHPIEMLHHGSCVKCLAFDLGNEPLKLPIDPKGAFHKGEVCCTSQTCLLNPPQFLTTDHLSIMPCESMPDLLFIDHFKIVLVHQNWQGCCTTVVCAVAF